MRGVMVSTDVFLFPFPLLFRPGAQVLPSTTFASEFNRTVSCTTATRGDMRDTACDRGTAGDGAPGGGLLETCSPPSESCPCCTFQHAPLSVFIPPNALTWNTPSQFLVCTYSIMHMPAPFPPSPVPPSGNPSL